MIKFIFQPKQKGLFKALGLHHAGVALFPLVVGLLLAHFNMPVLGAFIASGGAWYYAGREYKEYEIRGKTAFELMDSISPFIVSVSFFLLKGLLQ